MNSRKKITVEKLPVFSKKESLFFTTLAILGLLAIANYALWWFQYSHIAVNSFNLFSVDLFLFFLLSFVIWHGLTQRMAIWYIIYSMRKPKYLAPERKKKVALLTCFVPGSEPYDLLEATMKAMVDVTYPHDTWILDEGDDENVKALCRKYNVHHFSRKGIAKYNQQSGPFKAKTKAGNHNAWRDAHEYKYDYVAQMDMDHIPHKDYLDRILGYFKDEKVAFVVGPQIYANLNNWVAKGAAEQAYIFHGPIQQGFYKHDMPLFIGTNHVYRPKAIQSVGGYASTIVEDHLTGMMMYAKGWKGVYVPEIIADGEGPRTWIEYLNQQMRWSYGIFEILLKYSPKLLKHLTWPQRINFIASQTYYLTGVATVVSIFLTCLYLVFGYTAAQLDFTQWVIHALPPFAIAIFIQYWSQRFFLEPEKEKGHHLKGMLLSLGALPVYAIAFFYVLFNKKLQYIVTAKGEQSENVHVPLKTFVPHIVLIAASLLSFVFSFTAGNDAVHLRFWSIFTIIIFSIVVLSSRKLPDMTPRFVFNNRYSPAFAVLLILLVGSFFFANLDVNQTHLGGVNSTVASVPKLTTEQEKPYLGIIGFDVVNKVDTLENSIDKNVSIIGKYQSWGDNDNSFDVAWANTVKNKDSIALVSWQPWEASSDGSLDNTVQPNYSMRSILEGEHDAYITKYAQDVKRWNNPLIIRFAHEMNGNWYPWSGVNEGNSPEEYVAAWRYIHNKFAAEGVENVTWVWSPNEPYNDPNNIYSDNLDVFYPGDEYVDWIGFSGFNWGQSSEYSNWRTFDEIVDPAYSELVEYNKPLMITEINSTDIGGNKKQWMENMNADLKKYPFIKAVIWFDSENTADSKYRFKIDTNPSSYSAY